MGLLYMSCTIHCDAAQGAGPPSGPPARLLHIPLHNTAHRSGVIRDPDSNAGDVQQWKGLKGIVDLNATQYY